MRGHRAWPPYHADAISLHLELLHDVVDHERARLPHKSRLFPRAALDGADHAPVPRPFLCVREMRDRIQIGRDEFAALQLVDAQLGVLDLVVVDVPVKAHHDRADVVIHLDGAPGAHVGLLVLVRRPADVGNAQQIELLLNAHLSDDVHLLASGREASLLEIRCRREAAAEDLVVLHWQAQALELLGVALSRLGGVIGHEEEALAHGPQLVQHGRDPFNEGVASPDHAVAVEDEHIHAVQQLRRRRQAPSLS
eukprot:scaffold2429_cov263-Pinguiococcus_pyrenoidosus.AAC.2